MKKYSNVIGITGLPGAGKSFLTEQIGKATGIEVIDGDEILARLINLPTVKMLMGSKDKEVRLLDMMGRYRSVSLWNKVETELLKIIGNQMIKNALKGGKPAIVDSAFLPELSVAKKFSANYLVEGDKKLRNLRFAEREGVSIDVARVNDEVVSGLVDYNKLKYNSVIRNQENSGVLGGVQDIVDDINKSAMR